MILLQLPAHRNLCYFIILIGKMYTFLSFSYIHRRYFSILRWEFRS